MVPHVSEKNVVEVVVVIQRSNWCQSVNCSVEYDFPVIHVPPAQLVSNSIQKFSFKN